MRSLVTVVVPTIETFEGTTDQLKALEALARENEAPFEVVYVDDSAAAGELAARIAQWSTTSPIKVRVVGSSGPHGFAHAVTRGMACTTTPFALLLNSDCHPIGNCIDQLVMPMLVDPSVGVVGGLLLEESGRVQELGCWITQHAHAGQHFAIAPLAEALDSGLRVVDYTSGALMALRMDIWRLLGGFDLGFAPAYFEDSDFCVRVRQAGSRVVVNPLAAAFHVGGTSYGTDKSDLMQANAAKFRRKWANEPWVHPKSQRNGRRSPLRVLMIDWDVPSADRDSGSRRAFEIIRALRRSGAEVDFVPASGHRRGVYGGALETMGVRIASTSGSTVNQLVQQADVVWVSRPNAYDWLRRMCPYRPRQFIYDMVDLHVLRISREATLAQRDSGHASIAEVEAEHHALLHADVVIAVSSAEAQEATSHGARDVVVIGNAHPKHFPEPRSAPKPRCLFIGSQSHSPNVDALKWLLDDIWPRVFDVMPSAELVVAGMEATDLREHPGTTKLGWVRHVDEAYDGVAVALAPLRFGAGVKGKVTEAYAREIPVVGTEIAFEGLPLRAPTECVLAQDAQTFADSVLQLLRQPSLAAEIGREGATRLRQSTDPATVGAVVKAILARATPSD